VDRKRTTGNFILGGEHMSKVHDNIIKAYRVDFEVLTLTMNTLYYGHTNKIIENTDIIFTGYLTHIFGAAHEQNIIMDIEEWSIHQFLEHKSELLNDNKNYGWPISYKTENELIKFLQTNKYKIFEVASSFGLCGWVFAKQMDIVIDKQQFTPSE
jgi:hypothetical protein